MRSYRLILMAAVMVLWTGWTPTWSQTPPRIFVDQVEYTARRLIVDGVVYVDIQRLAQTVGWGWQHHDDYVSIAPTFEACTFPEGATGLIVMGRPFTGATHTEGQTLFVALPDLVSFLGGTVKDIPDLHLVRINVPGMPTAAVIERSAAPRAEPVPSSAPPILNPSGDVGSTPAAVPSEGVVVDKVYRNSALGFSMTYPSNLTLVDDPVLMKAVTSLGLDKAAQDNPEIARLARNSDTGIQFLIKDLNPEKRGVLMLVVGRMPNPGVTGKELATVLMLGTVQALKGRATALDGPLPVQIGSFPFYTFSLKLAGSATSVKERHFSYYDTKTLHLFDLVLVGRLDSFDADVAPVEHVVNSFRLNPR